MLHLRTNFVHRSNHSGCGPFGPPAEEQTGGFPDGQTELGRTLADLSRYRRVFDAAVARPRPQPAAAPETRLREVAAFGANPGNLRLFEYVPATLAEAPALVVVLHGCTQTAAGYDHGSGWSTLADRYGFALLFPSSSAPTTRSSASTGSSPATRRAAAARRCRSAR